MLLISFYKKYKILFKNNKNLKPMKTTKVIIKFGKKMTNTILAIGISANIYAVDICVNELGSGGCYSSISAAIAAANDGDRILIQPKAGNAPYVENLTINKSIQLLSNQEGVMWSLTGNITITPAIGRQISILHMNNNMGNITASGNSPSGVRCKVDIINCQLLDGYINLNYDNFEVNVVSSIINNGYVAFKYGNIIGNEIMSNNYLKMFNVPSVGYTLLYCSSDAVSTNDTINIVGNILKNQATVSTNYYNIFLNSNSYFFNVSNNYLTKDNTYYDCGGIIFNIHKSSTLGTNSIYNNTMYNPDNYNYGYFSISVNSTSNGVFDIKNNISICPNKSSGYNRFSFSSGPTIGFSYNYGTNNASLIGIPDNGTNNLNSNSSINVSNGQLNVASDGINGGYPDLSFYDLDLTVNDVGAYGGSYSLTNFHPITGAARVYYVKSPRTILQSGTLNIKANSFDR
mgnify:CR=1 FL=1